VFETEKSLPIIYEMLPRPMRYKAVSVEKINTLKSTAQLRIKSLLVSNIHLIYSLRE